MYEYIVYTYFYGSKARCTITHSLGECDDSKHIKLLTVDLFFLPSKQCKSQYKHVSICNTKSLVDFYLSWGCL